MRNTQQLLREPRPYRKPQVVDSGSVEFKTQNNVAPEDFEDKDDNIVWGNLATEGEGSEE